MSLRNYTVVTLPDADREMIELASERLDQRGFDSCNLCTRHSYGALTCGDCRHKCTHPDAVNGYIYRADGSMMAWSRCFRCGRMVKGLPRGSQIFGVCLRNNTKTPCERCGHIGSQYHHWAPQAIFADANDWPTAWLCQSCHSTWHRAMREAGGVSLPNKVRAA